MLKRLVDIIIALSALILLMPVFLIVIYKVRKNLGSPVFFLQERPGKDGKLFKMINTCVLKKWAHWEQGVIQTNEFIA